MKTCLTKLSEKLFYNQFFSWGHTLFKKRYPVVYENIRGVKLNLGWLPKLVGGKAVIKRLTFFSKSHHINN